MSTVVGIATGMFTLRDQVLPQESGSAQAALADYQTSVGAVCLLLNEGESARARDARNLARRLRRARSIPAQRDLLLDSTNRRIADLVNEIAKFSAITPPTDRAAEHRRTRAAWERNLERIRAYSHQLDGAASRAQLAAALDVLYRARVPLSRDGLSVRAGISQLGGSHCHLDKPIVTPNVTVPGLARDDDDGEDDDGGGGSATPPGGSGARSATPPDGRGGGSATPPSGGGSATPPSDGGDGAGDVSVTPPADGGDGAGDVSVTPPADGGDGSVPSGGSGGGSATLPGSGAGAGGGGE